MKLVMDSLPAILEAGLRYTIPLSVISFIIGIIIAVITALVRISNVKKGSTFTRLLKIIGKAFFSFYVWLFRGTPLIVQMFILFYGLPRLPAPYTVEFGAFSAAVIVFSLNVGAYASETIRAAILSISKGQWEAGYAIGMTHTTVLFRVILPQAARVSLPPLSNSFIGLIKDTSLAFSITIVEMFSVGQQIAARTYEPMVLYCEVAVVYLVFCSILNIGQYYLEKRTSRYIKNT